MFLPLHDKNPLRVIPFQLVTFSIIVLCVVVFLYQQILQGEQEQAFLHWPRNLRYCPQN
jgi:membrane associated rhomboid family serine protease